ncbi:hypothetical protein QBC37DRAFT_432193 [Rhypophila decipiens]|uniref:Uncharacterized protein n=1 Tax=Rhypophila decipiens TaxID=261697 RepID=A0AAN7B0M8_9PEZI|nr:hypothetical protein QBC37DRAFT_432193 [Rhypophila decipiens]
MLSAHPPLERATRPSPEDRGFRMVPPHADIEQPSNIPQYDGADERTEGDDGQLQMQRWTQVRQDHQMSYIDSFKPPPWSWDNPYTYLVDYPEVFVSVDPITRYVYHVVEGPEGQPRWFFFDNNTSYEYDPLSGWHRQENEDGTFTWWLTNYVTSDDQLDHGPATWGLYRKSKGPPRFPMWNRRLQQMQNKAKTEVQVEKAQKAQADQEAQAAREAQLALTNTEAAEAMDTS